MINDNCIIAYDNCIYGFVPAICASERIPALKEDCETCYPMSHFTAIIPGISPRHVIGFPENLMIRGARSETNLPSSSDFPTRRRSAARPAHTEIRPSISKRYFIIGLFSGSLGPTIPRFADYARRRPSCAEIYFLGRKIERSPISDRFLPKQIVPKLFLPSIFFSSIS